MFWKDAPTFLPILLEGLRLTVVVTIGSLALSTVLGRLGRLDAAAPAPWTRATLAAIARQPGVVDVRRSVLAA